MKSNKLAAFLAAVLLAALLVPVSPAFADDDDEDENNERRRRHVADQAIVGFTDRAEAEEVVEDSGAVVEEAFGTLKMMVVDTPTPATDWVESFQPEVAAEASVEFVQLDYIVTADTHTAVAPEPTGPNDTSWSSLYGMQKIGLEEAWHTTPGSEDIVVGVIDSGIDYNHPDLKEQMWVNADEVPGNGVDDDRNGWVDDVHGADCANNDGNPMDDNNHGTHVAGTIGATANNAMGVAGVADTSLMALKFLGSSGSGSTSNAVECLQYAINNGAHLTSNSWGGGSSSTAMRNAITDAANDNQLFIAAAGNSAVNNDSSPHYPSSYPHENVISVAATDSSDRLASFSNYGANSVDLAAPGVGILSTVVGGGYKSYNGTSMATPHVAGVAALLLAQQPGAGYAAIKERLYSSVDKISALSAKTVTGGRLNAAKAVGAPVVTPQPEPIETSPSETPTSPGTGTTTTPADAKPAMPGTLTATAGTDSIALEWPDNTDTDLAGYKVFRRSAGSTEFAEVGQTTAGTSAYTDAGMSPGDYTYLVRAYDAKDQLSDPSNEVSATIVTPKVLQKTSFVPSAAAPIYEMGSLYRGSYRDLASDDGRYYQIRSVRQSDRRTYRADWESITTLSGISDATSLSLTFNGRVSSSYATQTISVKTSTGWLVLHTLSGSSRDRTVTWSTDSPADYLVSGTVTLKVEASRTSSSFYSYGDYIRWDVEHY